MTVEEYFAQARLLNQMIRSNLREVEDLRSLACSISSPVLKERVCSSSPNEAPFVRSVEKIMALEAVIGQKISMLVDLKEQIRTVIDALPSHDEQLAVRYRVLDGYTWEAIGKELHIDAKTAKHWYEMGVSHAKVPDFPVVI